MLWYTDNTFVKEDKDGNKRFLKKEPLRRKTDGFHAFIAALYKREIIQESTVGDFLDVIEDWEFQKGQQNEQTNEEKTTT